MIKSLQGIRCILALGIFITHLSILRITILDKLYSDYLIGLGAFGVLFFFILSGFGVTVGYAKKIDKIFSKETLLFYKKRFLSLYPAHWLVLLLCFVLNINNLKEFIGGGRDLFVNITLLNAIIPSKNYNPVTWYLGVLIIAYILTPIIIFIIKKLEKVKVNMILLALAIYGVQLIRVFININNPMQQKLFYTDYTFRIWDYIIGMLLGYYYYKNKDRLINKNKSILKNSVLEIIWLILLIAAFVIRPNIPVPFLQGTYYTWIVILFIYIFMKDSGIVSKILGSKLFLICSSISFEFYLIHFTIITYSNGKFKNIALLIITEFIISIALSIVLHVILNVKKTILIIENINLSKVIKVSSVIISCFLELFIIKKCYWIIAKESSIKGFIILFVSFLFMLLLVSIMFKIAELNKTTLNESTNKD